MGRPPRRRPAEDHPGGYLVETLRAVFQAPFATDGFEAALVDVVNRGGDSDTTGAILGMIAGARSGDHGLGEMVTYQLVMIRPVIREIRS